MDIIDGQNGATKPRAQMLITLMSDGQLAVQGPIQDKILCYGMMETARDIIAAHKPSAIVSPIAQFDRG
jgi:hypothetical protein